MSRRIGRRVRCALAALMLLTGLLGQAGHNWAHGDGHGHRAWTAALEAKRAWLGGTALADGDAESNVIVFGASLGHSHGDGTDNHQDGLATDHAHSVVFLMPPGMATDMRGVLAVRFWYARIHVPAAHSDNPDRPPRTA